MSPKEMGNKLTEKKAEKLDHKIARLVAVALKQDYGDERHAIKRISRDIPIDSLNTIKAWYEGRNPPNAGHLVMLALHSPNVMRVLMELLGKYDFWERYQQEFLAADHATGSIKNKLPVKIYTEKSFGINVRIDFAVGSKLNARQLWFLGLIQQGHKLKANHIAVTWRVSNRAGEADIAGLVKAQQIRFEGSKKTGFYKLF